MGTFASRIKQLRLERGLTQEQVAKAVGVTQRAVSKLETGESAVPEGPTLIGLAKLYDVDPMALLSADELKKSVSSLNDDEAELLLLFRSVGPSARQYLLGRAREIHADEYAHKEQPPSPSPTSSGTDQPSPGDDLSTKPYQ